MCLPRKNSFFFFSGEAHGIVPGWSRTTNLSSFRNRTRYPLRHGENTLSFSTKKILFILLLYTVYSLLFWTDNIVKKGDDTRVPTLPIDAR